MQEEILRICPQCGVEKHLNKENFEPRRKGYRRICRKCRNKQVAAHNKQRYATDEVFRESERKRVREIPKERKREYALKRKRLRFKLLINKTP